MADWTWPELADLLEKLTFLLLRDGEGNETPILPERGPVSPDVEDMADRWMLHFAYHGLTDGLTPELRYALLPRARYALRFVSESSQRRAAPASAGAGTDKPTLLGTLLVEMWHEQWRAEWLHDPRRN